MDNNVEIKKGHENRTPLNSKDIFILKPEQEGLLNECCDCGLWHMIEFSKRDKDLKIRFIRIEGKPNYNEYDLETHIIRSK